MVVSYSILKTSFVGKDKDGLVDHPHPLIFILLTSYLHAMPFQNMSETKSHVQVLLNELGFDKEFLTPFRDNYLNPIAHLLFEDCGGGVLDSHKAFVVKYKEGEDTDLSYHYDNAEVTINVSLGKDFTDSQLYFGAMRHVWKMVMSIHVVTACECLVYLCVEVDTYCKSRNFCKHCSFTNFVN